MTEESMLPLKIHLCSHLPRSQKLLHLQRLGVKMRLSPSLILLPGFQVVSSDVKGLRQVTEGRKEILLILLSLPLHLPCQAILLPLPLILLLLRLPQVMVET